jgi:protein phosphatase
MDFFGRALSTVSNGFRRIFAPLLQARSSAERMRQNNIFSRTGRQLRMMRATISETFHLPSLRRNQSAEKAKAEKYQKHAHEDRLIVPEVGGSIEKYRQQQAGSSRGQRRKKQIMQYQQLHLVEQQSGERFIAHLGAESGNSSAEMTIRGVRLIFTQQVRGDDMPLLLVKATPSDAFTVEGRSDPKSLQLEPHSRIMVHDSAFRIEMLAQDDLGLQTPLQAAWETSTGPIRQDNQDAIGIFQHPATSLFAVADGVGGGYAGDRMSAYAIQYLLKAIEFNHEYAPQWEDLLQHSFQNANAEIRNYMQNVPQQAGTTLTAVVIDKWNATIAHVGDSRCYLLRRGKLHVLTQDHAQTIQIDSEDGARTRTILSRAIGRDNTIIADTSQLQLIPRDRLLLCTDGITNRLPSDEIARILQDQPLQQAARVLVERANIRRNTDNASAIVIDILDPTDARPSWQAEPSPRVFVASKKHAPDLVGLDADGETRSGGCLRVLLMIGVIALILGGIWYVMNGRGGAPAPQATITESVATATERSSTRTPVAVTITPTTAATVTLRALPTQESERVLATTIPVTAATTQVFEPTSTLRVPNQ